MGKRSAGISIAQGIPIAVRKHVISGKSLSRGSIAVRIDKPSPGGVIVPAVQVVQPRFGVVDIPAITQGIRSAEGGSHGAVGGQGRAPGVVAVGHRVAVAVDGPAQPPVLVVGIAVGDQGAASGLHRRGQVKYTTSKSLTIWTAAPLPP